MRHFFFLERSTIIHYLWRERDFLSIVIEMPFSSDKKKSLRNSIVRLERNGNAIVFRGVTTIAAARKSTEKSKVIYEVHEHIKKDRFVRPQFLK